MSDGARSSKAPDAAVVLPVLGVFLLMPPVISLFVTPLSIWGVPVIVVYVFGVWIGLILCALLLARRLPGTEPIVPDASPVAGEDPRAENGDAPST